MTLANAIEQSKERWRLSFAADYEAMDLELSRIDVLVDRFERKGQFKNHSQVNAILKLAQYGRDAREWEPKFCTMVEKAMDDIDRIRVQIMNSDHRDDFTLTILAKLSETLDDLEKMAKD